jgi:hypothetical protein
MCRKRSNRLRANRKLTKKMILCNIQGVKKWCACSRTKERKVFTAMSALRTVPAGSTPQPPRRMQMQFSLRPGPAGRLVQRSGRIDSDGNRTTWAPACAASASSVPWLRNRTRAGTEGRQCRVPPIHVPSTSPRRSKFRRRVPLARPSCAVLQPDRKWRATPHTPRARLSSCLAIRHGFASHHTILSRGSAALFGVKRTSTGSAALRVGPVCHAKY